ncbi:TetR/AcrR family transcriptional regulator [Bailinhaonella thermotolerans]|uniref:TetR/AcrR family transcriptional regulator n=1 Tax=Bailinhaonella thermotolerans TaxID=1070861 RepID=A0A3A4AVE6_9ACTN|nr:TetR/AcrR family transcriptional regulator [Bailinhaonella thermotolerans]
MGRPLRADAERTVRAILEAAERVLAQDPAASMERIAEEAGVNRTTIHRRFASREALLEAMTLAALGQVREAIEAGRPETAPPEVALHQITANVLAVKLGWRFALTRPAPEGSPAARAQEEIVHRCDTLLAKVQRAGLIRPDVDVTWARQVYYALLYQALESAEPADLDARAALVVRTLLHGIG